MAEETGATLYDVLGVNRNASADQIKHAYREVAKRAHPDGGGDAARFDAATKAYEVLSDPEQRALYDQWIEGAGSAQRYDHDATDTVVDLLGQIRLVRHQAKRAMVGGAAWLLGGSIISFGSYSAAASSEDGGRYTVLWGAVAFGALKMFRAIRTLVAARRAEAQIIRAITNDVSPKRSLRIPGVAAAMTVGAVIIAGVFGVGLAVGASRRSGASSPANTVASVATETTAAPSDSVDSSGIPVDATEAVAVLQEPSTWDDCWLVQIASTRTLGDGDTTWYTRAMQNFKAEYVYVVGPTEWPEKMPEGTRSLALASPNRADAESDLTMAKSSIPSAFIRHAPLTVCQSTQTLAAVLASPDVPDTTVAAAAVDQRAAMSVQPAVVSASTEPAQVSSEGHGTWGTDIIGNAELTCDRGYYRKGYGADASCRPLPSDPHGTWGTDILENAELTCVRGYYRKGYGDQGVCRPLPSDLNGSWGSDILGNAELTCDGGFTRKGYGDQAACVTQ